MKIEKTFFLLLLFIALITSSKAQDSTKINAWVNTGAGINSLEFGFNIGLNFQVDDILITTKFGANGEIFGDELIEGGLLIGYRVPLNNALLTISGGLSEISYSESKGLFSNSIESKLLGIIFESQISYLFWKFFGVGLCSYINMNNRKTIVGANLNIFIGIMNN